MKPTYLPRVVSVPHVRHYSIDTPTAADVRPAASFHTQASERVGSLASSTFVHAVSAWPGCGLAEPNDVVAPSYVITQPSNDTLMHTQLPITQQGLGRRTEGFRYVGQILSVLLLLAGTFFSATAATINVPADQPTIAAAVAAAAPGDVIVVAPGMYVENVTINKSLTLRSSGGRAVTTIQGSSGLGTVVVQANDVTLGGIGQGFTIRGYDSPSPGLENAAVYIQGVRSNVSIRGNEIFADGEAGLLTEFGQAVNNLVVSANIFSGKTFVGAEAGDCGFGNQFTAPNVPRQLVAIHTGSGITFTSNQITGIAGSNSSVPACATFGQGNTLVTIDANNATIRGNTFAGTTTRFGHSLRVRGTGANISCNTFDNAGLGLACVHFFSTVGAIAGLGSPNTLAGIASANTFVNEGAYFTGAVQIYRSSAQVSAIPQTPIAANSAASPLVTNTNTSEVYCSIQDAINDVNTVAGHSISVSAGTYNEDVLVNKQLTILGAGIDQSIVSGPMGGDGATFRISATGVVIDGFTITRDGNNTTDWNNAGLNFAGVAVQGLYSRRSPHVKSWEVPILRATKLQDHVLPDHQRG